MSARGRFTTAATIGSVLGAGWFAWMLTAGTFDFLAWQPVADFYDAQAHALLAGRLDLPASVMGIEGFVVDGKTYMYQGPAPALVRLPVAALTHELDGRLSRASMMVAFVIAVAAAMRILWRVRVRLRGGAPVETGEAVFVGVWAFVVSGGSTLLFTGSRSYVYHESLLWALAFALASFDALLGWSDRPSRARLAAAGTFATLALLSRASVGLGPVGALGLLTAVAIAQRARTHSSGGSAPATRRIVALGAAAAIPVVLYAGINVAKFGTLVSVPWPDQVYSSIVTERQEFLAANGGDFFGLQFVPETARRYLRPDAFSLRRELPFVDFEPPPPSPVVGGVRFDTIDVSASLTATMPFLWLLALVGAVAMIRRSPDRVALAPLRAPVAGAAVGAMAIFPFGYVAQRYLGDWLPLLVLLGSAGLVVCTRPAHGAARVRVAALALLGVAAAWTVVANSALALSYQRQYSNPTIGEDVVRRFVDWRARIGTTYLNRDDLRVVTGDRAPAWAPAGELFIVGDCDGLYLSDGLRVDEVKASSFKPVVRRAGAGSFRLRVRPAPTPRGTRVPLLTGGDGDASFAVWVQRRAGDRAVVGYDGPGVERTVSRELHLPVGEEAIVHVAADPNVRLVEVVVNGRGVLGTYFDGRGPYRVGRSEGVAGLRSRFRGSIDVEPVDVGTCRRLQPLARPAG